MSCYPSLARIRFCRRFYLGGGTALALRLGHRMSHDLDFFSGTDRVDDATRAEIVDHLRREFSDIVLVTDTPGDLTATIVDRHVGFYSSNRKNRRGPGHSWGEAFALRPAAKISRLCANASPLQKCPREVYPRASNVTDYQPAPTNRNEHNQVMVVLEMS